MNLLIGHDKDVSSWVAGRIDSCARGFGESKAIGVRHRGELVAGVVYHDWSPEFETIQMSGAAINKRWMTRPIIHGLLSYPFSFCQMAWMQTDTDNPARSIWLRLGAAEHVIPRLRGKNRDGVIATLTKEDWQAGKFFMRSEHG